MTRDRGTISVLQALLLGPLPLALALAQDWYVDVNAPNCGTGTGTQADPFCDVMDAVAAAADGDTIHIAPGAYFENVVIGKDLTLIGTGGEQVTILDGSGSGPVIRVVGASLSLAGLTITNGLTDYGGGISALDFFGYGAQVSVRDSIITGNFVSPGGRSASGAGIFCFRVSLTLIDSTVTNNSAGLGTGGIHFDHGSLHMTNSVVSGNSPGGIVASGEVTVVGSTIRDNVAFGVAVFGDAYEPYERGTLTLTNTTVSGNSGLGILVGTYDPYYAYPADGALENSTVTGNSGGGLRVCGSLADPSSTSIQNSILWGNGASSISLSGTGASTTAEYTLVEGGWPGSGNLDADPLFVDAPNGDFRLLPGSPCIDAGNNMAVPPGVWLDLGGKRRFIDDPLTPDTGHPGRLLPIVDLGAHEFGNNPPTRVRSR